MSVLKRVGFTLWSSEARWRPGWYGRSWWYETAPAELMRYRPGDMIGFAAPEAVDRLTCWIVTATRKAGCAAYLRPNRRWWLLWGYVCRWLHWSAPFRYELTGQAWANGERPPRGYRRAYHLYAEEADVWYPWPWHRVARWRSQTTTRWRVWFWPRMRSLGYGPPAGEEPDLHDLVHHFQATHGLLGVRRRIWTWVVQRPLQQTIGRVLERWGYVSMWWTRRTQEITVFLDDAECKHVVAASVRGAWAEVFVRDHAVLVRERVVGVVRIERRPLVS